MWKWVRKRIRPRRQRRVAHAKHYREHKEAARAFVHARLLAINAEHYNFTYNRVAIRNTRSRWGSCSKRGNLNFNYRLLFLPPHLADYVIAHELCHLQEFNHGPHFWALVEKVIPGYRQCRAELRGIRSTSYGTKDVSC